MGCRGRANIEIHGSCPWRLTHARKVVRSRYPSRLAARSPQREVLRPSDLAGLGGGQVDTLGFAHAG